MYLYKLDYALEKIFTTEPRNERILLKKYTGKQLSEQEASWLWERISDHKWHLSERLMRDVGFHVAAVDYVENFYEPVHAKSFRERILETWEAVKETALRYLKVYFESKGQVLLQ